MKSVLCSEFAKNKLDEFNINAFSDWFRMGNNSILILKFVTNPAIFILGVFKLIFFAWF